MEVINDQSEDFTILQNNKIYGNLSLKKSSINFKGQNNVLFCEDGVKLENTVINFNGNNSFFYLSNSSKAYLLNFSIMDNSDIYIGKNNYFNGRLTAIVSEEKSLCIGNDCLFSFGIWIRTSDAHSIYDCQTKNRINRGKNILIGDHVWIGQDAFIAKNTKIGSGSIIGTKSVLAGKNVGSNTIYAGNPAKKIKENVFFTGESAHKYSPQKDQFSSEEYIYNLDDNSILFDQIEVFLSKQKTFEEKIYFYSQLNKAKNRFYLPLKN